ncbi:hypothetical protein EVAR_8335_1 [Eumeta japonica]|uniref:Uncharacterized protein n=1 Tax=Eumeta variegata TaxID=151549 RepID=A0A4C1VDY0_EUMVA|nr:hypothetical protein EVAR_8335_1 [Eumeta japonica]
MEWKRDRCVTSRTLRPIVPLYRSFHAPLAHTLSSDGSYCPTVELTYPLTIYVFQMRVLGRKLPYTFIAHWRTLTVVVTDTAIMLVIDDLCSFAKTSMVVVST